MGLPGLIELKEDGLGEVLDLRARVLVLVRAYHLNRLVVGVLRRGVARGKRIRFDAFLSEAEEEST